MLFDHYRRRPVAALAVPVIALLIAGCSPRTGEVSAKTSALGSDDPDDPGDPGDRGPLPDPCPDGQTIVCDESACGCGVAADDPETCDPQVDCSGDGECGDGQCCYHGSCVAKDGACACGDTRLVSSSSAMPGCPGADQFADMVKQEAQNYCLINAPEFGNMCSSLGQCIGSAGIDDVTTQCFDSGNEDFAGMEVAVCFHCDEADPPGVPPNNADTCNDLSVKISNKKAEINAKQLEIKYLVDGIAKLNAAIASTENFLTSLQNAENGVISGAFGDNIFLKTAGQTTKFVTDIYGGAKAVSSVSKVGCLANRAYCGTNLVGRVPNMSWKMVLLSKRAWGEVYEPAVAFGISQAVGAGGEKLAGCPAPGQDPPDDGWFSWWPGLSSGQWFVGCFTKDSVIQQIGENRLNAINNKRDLTTRRDAMSAERDQALIDLGMLQAELEALQQQYNDTCTCDHP